MKYKNFQLLLLAVVVLLAGCGNMDYKKTKSGLLYKIISSGSSNGAVAKENGYLKFNVVTKLNDSIMYSSYGKLPGYSKVLPAGKADYSPSEIFGLLKKGDSAITVSMIDTFLKRGMASQLPPAAKKGDKLTITFKVLDIFPNDSLVKLDYDAEMAKDQPRQQQEMKEQIAKERQRVKEQIAKEQEELAKSGEIDKELKSMAGYLAAKKITAQKVGKGTFVLVKEPGEGPALNQGDTITVKYTGRFLETDSVFQSNTYTFPVGEFAVIQGWDEGLMVFKKGGKGTLYIPGFLAYGRDARPPFKPFDPLKFDVEMIDIKPVNKGSN